MGKANCPTWLLLFMHLWERGTVGLPSEAFGDDWSPAPLSGGDPGSDPGLCVPHSPLAADLYGLAYRAWALFFKESSGHGNLPCDLNLKPWLDQQTQS